MNNMLKKEDNKNDLMSMIASVLKNSIPKPTPEMPYNHGLVGGFFHNWKMDQVEESSKHAAKIAEYKEKAFNHQASIIKQLANMKNEQTERENTYAHNQIMREEQQKQEKIKTQSLYHQADKEGYAAEREKHNAEMERLAVEIQKNHLKEMLGGDHE